MNIIDMLAVEKKQSSSELSNKIAKNSEIRKIERRADDIAFSVENFIADEARFIENGLSYSPTESRLSDEDKEELLKKLKEVSKTIGEKVNKIVNEIFDGVEKEENKEEPKEEKPESKEVELKVETPAIPQTTTPAVFPSFGY